MARSIHPLATIGRLAMLLALGLVVFAPARAQQPQPPAQPPPPEHPAIEPVAIEMLKAMSQRLAGAKSMNFTAVTTYELPARNGQPLYYATLSQVAVQRPNKLRVITPGDGPASEFYYDGKTMMVSLRQRSWWRLPMRRRRSTRR